ncbi:MAG TPA: sulfatase [Solirubrobacterales bacterium]|jgi:arylsulfatase A-like enzyme|nr:sulfatase [Solirubrobacterales bacterium]
MNTTHLATSIRARVSARLAITIAGLTLLTAFALATGQARAATEGRPSFVVIQTDDETLDQLYASYTPPGAGTIEAMPFTRQLIAERGATFNRYYTPYSLCAPSRVSLLTGRYAHNNNVRGNVAPEGGYPGFASRSAYSNNLATWLQGAGYRTIHIGKFLNAYGEEPYDSGTEVPPGWDAWHTVLNSDSTHYFYGYSLNNNGAIEGPYGDSGSWETREYGQKDDFGCPYAPLNGLPCLYETDIFNRIATEELSGTPAEKPFYMQLDYTAPHGDFRRPAGPEPAPRDNESFAGAPFPHGPSQGFNEGNVNDKPSFIREAPLLSPTEIHTYRVYYQKALESLRSVDEGVKDVVDTLGALHRLRNTYIIFTSDNGFFYGEHRLTGGKFLAYEPSTHLPLLIRGPGIKAGSQTGELASTIDIAPTILELAGVETGKVLDGRSLYPYAHDPSLRTRRPLLFESFVETNDVDQNGGATPAEPTEPTVSSSRAGTAGHRGDGASASIVAPPRNYYGIRLGPYKYIEWPDGEKELYDITKDPYELNNKVRDKNFAPIRTFLHNELVRLETCIARQCQEVAPKFPLTRDQQLRVKRQKEKEQREREREREKHEEEKHQAHK